MNVTDRQTTLEKCVAIGRFTCTAKNNSKC